MQALSVSVKPPGPSGPGKRGEVLKVLSNHFVVNPNDIPDLIYKWNVEIRPANPDQNRGPVVGRVTRRVHELLLQIPGYNVGVYSDFSQTLRSFKDLRSTQNAPQMVNVDYFEREESGPRTGAQQLVYQVRITLAMPPLPSKPLKDLFTNPGPGTVIQDGSLKEYEASLNLMVLRYASLNDHLETAQRGTKIFPKRPNFPAGNTPKRQDLGGALTAYRGYERRAKIVQGGVMVALNTTASVMYQEGRASELIGNWKRAHPYQPDSALDSFVRGVRVQGLFGPRRVKPILSVVAGNAQNTTFHCDTHPKTQTTVNRRVNVVWFFKEAYGIDLSPGGVVLNVGSTQRSIIWPAELCQVLPAQGYRKLLPLREQAQSMIQFACRSSAANAQLILSEGLEMLGVNLQGGAVNGTLLKLLLEIATVPARKIPSPSLVFGQSMLSGKDTAKGQWNLQGRKFIKSPTANTRFKVIVLKRKSEPGLRNLQEFRDAIKTGLRAYCGINETCTSVPDVADALDWPSQNPVNWLKSLFNHCGGKSNVCYCFLIVSDSDWYHSIKEAGDSVGMHTTVVLRKSDTTVKAAPGFIANLTLKYSMKTQGVNWNLAQSDFGKILNDQPTMLLGLDVVHPPPGAMKFAPSVAGLVFSIAASPGQFIPYVNLLQAEEGKKAREVVPTGSLRPMIEYALRGWRKHNNNALPRRMFMTRDGVSDAQLQQVLDVELPAIKQAAIKVYEEHKQPPPEVFILNTNKRHITRFFRAKEDTKGTAFDPQGNPLPGLIVDQRITSRTTDDWYAVSHKCLQGTSRPAHHTRLFDEIHLSKSDLQRLVHNLSFIYPRSVTSVSIPTPAKLADRLCERAKTRMHPVYFPSEENQGRTWSIHDGWFNGQQDVHPRIRDTMYYI